MYKYIKSHVYVTDFCFICRVYFFKQLNSKVITSYAAPILHLNGVSRTDTRYGYDTLWIRVSGKKKIGYSWDTGESMLDTFCGN